MALVWRRMDEYVNARAAVLGVRDLLAQLWRMHVDATLGSRKSSTGCGGLWICLRGASWRNVRAAEDVFECVSCEQRLVILLVAMVCMTKGREVKTRQFHGFVALIGKVRFGQEPISSLESKA